MEQNIKKIKSQKNAALGLIFGAFIILIQCVFRTDFDNYQTLHYMMTGGSSILLVLGVVGFIRSSRKLKGRE